MTKKGILVNNDHFFYLVNPKNFWQRIKLKIKIRGRKAIKYFLYLFYVIGFLNLIMVIFKNLKYGNYNPSFLLKDTDLILFWGTVLIISYLTYLKNKRTSLKNITCSSIENSFWPDNKKLKKIIINHYFSSHVNEIVSKVLKQNKDGKINSQQLINDLLKFSSLKKILLVANLEKINIPDNNNTKVNFQQIILDAFKLILTNSEKSFLDIETVFTILVEKGYLDYVFRQNNISKTEILEIINRQHDKNNNYQKYTNILKKVKIKKNSNINGAMTSRPTPLLNNIGVDLTLQAKLWIFDIIINRQEEIKSILRLLNSSNNGILLLGEPGIGKTALIQHLAIMMAAEDVPSFLEDKRIVSLNLSNLITGQKLANAEIAQKFTNILKEINSAGNIILCLEDLATLSGSASQSTQSDILNIILSFLPNSSVKIIATSNNKDYYQYLSKNDNFHRSFQIIKITEMDKNNLIEILKYNAYKIQQKKWITFTLKAIYSTFDYSDRFIYENNFPAKGITTLEQTALFVKSNHQNKVLSDDVAQYITSKTGIKINSINSAENNDLINLEANIKEKIIGQDTACHAVAEAIKRARLDLRDQSKPIANFLFLGSTGIGKTELSKTVAEIYFGDSNKMIRVDMSEYQLKESISNLIDTLTTKIRTNPYSLLLLDEIEKAHPDLLNLFLGVMDDGRLSNANGELINFRNTIIIATSNAGSIYIQEEIIKGTNSEKITTELKEKILLQYFKPEFINRFDSIIVFNSLDKKTIIYITKLLLDKEKNLFKQKWIEFEYTPWGLNDFALKYYNKKYWARPLKHAIAQNINSKIANLILNGKLKMGDKIVLKENNQLETDTNY